MRVLIIDDDEVDYMNIERQFGQAFPSESHEFTWVKKPEISDIAAKLDDSDICFLDQHLGAETGLELLKGLAAHELDVPIVLLTGNEDPDIDDQAMEHGAADYLVKDDLTPSLLKRAVKYSIAHKDHEKRLAKLAFTDGLTGLANRIKFDQALELAVQTTARNGQYLALVLIDLDDFKMINDTYGHAAGDILLKELSARIKELVRQSDIVARLGGDEFGVVINGYSKPSDIHILTDKILSVFETPLTYGEETFHGKGSLGVAILAPDEQPRDATALMRAADGALYRAKHKGKNTVIYYDQRLGETIQQSASMENALTKAIENEELELYFQPKINSETLTLSGAEVLLRWHWGENESVPPGIFIPVAERSLSILDIGKWVIEETCRKMQSWAHTELATVPIAINVSPIQLQSSTFVEHVTKTLAEYQIDPSLIEFEITETTLMEHVNHITDRMNTLAELGCKWVIDDFGIGHSSLSRLTDLPISKIKVDQTFVQQAPTSPSNQKICSIIALLAHELDLCLVAEGVETLAHINALSLLPHDELQGYYFSKPMPAADFEVWLKPEKVSECVDNWLANAAITEGKLHST
ncbi:MAG: EAL domain-containing protein [Kordiimonas sp.]